MQRSSRNWIAVVTLVLGAIGCTDEGVGDPCIPEVVPCSADGKKCGYQASEAYVEASSVQCRSRLCLVYKLDNETAGAIPSDPRKLCGDDDSAGCLDPDALKRSVYCTCRCEGGQSPEDNCACPDDYDCVPVLNLGGEGIKGSYCVRKGSDSE